MMPRGQGSPSRDPRDIRQFLDDFESHRHQPLFGTPPEGLNQYRQYPQATGTHTSYPFAASRMRYTTGVASDGMISTRGVPTRMMSNGTTTTISSMSYSNFDDSMSTFSTVASTVPEDIGINPTPYYCEFLGYTGCDRVFGSDQFEEWFQHIAGDHLKYRLPRKSMCWHCDQERFEARSNTHNDLMDCFRERMTHIARHLRGVLDLGPMRPDFSFAEHIYQLGLISRFMFEKVKDWHEMPSCLRAGVNTEIPPVREAPLRVIVNDRRRRVGRQDRSVSYQQQAYHR